MMLPVPIHNRKKFATTVRSLWLLIGLIIACAHSSLAQELPWTRQFGTSADDRVTGVASDAAGAWAVGATAGTLRGQRSSGGVDFFLRRMDNSGNELWTQQYGTAGDDFVTGMIVSGAGIYVSGHTNGNFPGQSRLGGFDAFLMRLDAQGQIIWVRQFGTSAGELSTGVTSNSPDAIYFAGNTGGVMPGVQLINATGLPDGFFMRFDANGNLVWTRQFGTLGGTDEISSIAAGVASIFIVGRTNRALPQQTALGEFDFFIWRFDLNGNQVWLRQSGTGADDEARAVTIANDGVYLAGNTAGTLPNQTSAGGSSDAFVSKYDFEGNSLWTRQFGSGGEDSLEDASAYDAAPSGVQVVGSTTGNLPGFRSSGGRDVIRRRFSSTGGDVNIQQFGTSGEDAALTIFGSFIGGYATGALFGQTASGAADGFVIRLASVLRVFPTSLRTVIPAGSPSVRRRLVVTGGGIESWTAGLRILNGQNWVSLVTAGGGRVTEDGTPLELDFNFAALATPGIYQALLSVSGEGGFNVTVPISVVLSRQQARMVLNRNDFVFRTQQGSRLTPPQPLAIGNQGTQALSWSVNALGLPSWLLRSALNGTVDAGARGGVVGLTADPTGLAPGLYQTVLKVEAPGAANSPQEVTVSFHVIAANASPLPEISLSGLVYLAALGGPAQAQRIDVGNAGAGTVVFQAVASTATGGNWLSVLPASGTTVNGDAPLQVIATPGQLAAGIYRGRITASFSSGESQELEVVLVVAPAGVLPQRTDGAAVDCTPQRMDMVTTTLGNGMNVPVSFPRSILAQVVDDCGQLVDGATVFATIEALNIPLQRVGSGSYSGPWTPQNGVASLDVVLSATHSLLGSVTRNYRISTSAASGGASLPVISPDGVVEGAGFTALRPLAPGSIISIFGSQFATGNFEAAVIPLPRTLGVTRVLVGGEESPLYFVGPGQINAQVPFAVREGETVSVTVDAGGRLTAPQLYVVAPNQPGVFRVSGVAAVLDAQFRPINEQNPARAGQVIQIFASGLGLVDQQITSGAAAPDFSTTLLPVTVLLGGQPASVLYQGLAPRFVGLYQVNVVVPAGVPAGNAVPVVIRQNGIDSNPDYPVVTVIQ